jgi:CubicO group peptidase (beta-lactamase class C family)
MSTPNSMKQSCLRRIGLIVLALALAACGGAPNVQPTAPASALEAQVDAYLAPMAQRGDFSGSVLLARGGTIQFSRAYGMASLEFDIPNTPQTKFRIASITKTFTALAIMQLQQQGRLKIGDSICTYLPDCPAAWQPATIEQLLTHTSGIPDALNCQGCPRPPIRASMAIPEMIQTVTRFYQDAPLVTEAGSTYSYSNLGYGLLGYIIEKASGQRYEDYLKAAIFDPLAMSNTGQDRASLVLKNRATGYATINTLADYNNIDLAYSAGGLYTSAEDLYKWDQALYTEKLLPANLRDALFEPRVHVADSDGEYDYGYGWHLSQRAGHAAVWHSGLLPGFRSILLRYPAEQATVIVLCNIETVDIDTVSNKLAEMLFNTI